MHTPSQLPQITANLQLSNVNSDRLPSHGAQDITVITSMVCNGIGTVAAYSHCCAVLILLAVSLIDICDLKYLDLCRSQHRGLSVILVSCHQEALRLPSSSGFAACVPWQLFFWKRLRLQVRSSSSSGATSKACRRVEKFQAHSSVRLLLICSGSLRQRSARLWPLAKICWT